ncbi:MAG: M13 family metallopeptidase [Nannocystaceae bacterium]
MPRLISSTLPAAALLFACTTADAPPKGAKPEADPAPPTKVDPEPAPAAVRSKESIAAEVQAAMDTSVDPCQDLYRYACGGWIKSTELPGDQSRWGRSFSVLREQNRELMREILEAAAKSPEGDGEAAKLGRYYAACMDEAAIEAAGVAPLQPLLAEIDAVKDAASFMTVAGKLAPAGVHPIFGLYVAPDDKDPRTNIAHVYQGGLGLPDRDYYLDKKNAEILKKYEAHVAKTFALAGETEAAAAKIARDVVAFETALAKKQMTRVERRDPDKTYNKIDRAGIEAKAPKLHWAEYAEASGHPEITAITVDSVDYLVAAGDLLAKAKPETLRDYLRWSVLDDNAEHLSRAFVAESFDFNGKTLRGQKEDEVRWKRCTSMTDHAFAHPLGKLYVERAFAGESKNIAKDLIGRIEGAFEEALPGLAWMSDKTRARAMEKVKAIYNKIGYPEKWRDYSGLSVGAGDHFSQVLAARRFDYDYYAAQVGKPVDRDEWRYGPPVVNASYSGTRNEMWFPAGILQAPFFDKDFPMAMNFGGIGVVMGHELTHGFDDQGRKYDAQGMLQQWWEDDVIGKFDERTACVDKAYAAREAEPGLHLDGKLTLGENTADMGGLRQAYRAYKKWAAEHGGDAEPHVPGLTNDQLLFVSFAQVWCTVATPEYLRVQVATDPHSPGEFRANVPASMSADFAAAFQCPEGAPMAPKDRCEVW